MCISLACALGSPWGFEEQGSKDKISRETWEHKALLEGRRGTRVPPITPLGDSQWGIQDKTAPFYLMV